MAGELIDEIRELKQLFEDEIAAVGNYSMPSAPDTAVPIELESTEMNRAGSAPQAGMAGKPRQDRADDSRPKKGPPRKKQQSQDAPESTSAKTSPADGTTPNQPVNTNPGTMAAKVKSNIADKIPAGSVLHTMTTLKEVEDYVANTVLIPLDKERLNPVFGVGNPDADLMVIGEAPGADEDKKGEPFVGRAGQLLNKILAAIDFAREDVYIANILKSRPPKNRNPLPEEIEKHIPILHKQIDIINPRIILCVGKVAANNLLANNSSLGSMRGKLHDLSGVPVVVTYHPAALLRNPNWKAPTWEDVQFLRSEFDKMMSTTTS